MAIPIVYALKSISNCILTDDEKFKSLLNPSQRMFIINKGKMISKVRGLRLALGSIIAPIRINHKTDDRML